MYIFVGHSLIVFFLIAVIVSSVLSGGIRGTRIDWCCAYMLCRS